MKYKEKKPLEDVTKEAIEGKIEQLEKRVSKIEEFINDLKGDGLVKILNKTDFEGRSLKDAWFFGKYGFERWIIEKIMNEPWQRNPTHAYHFLGDKTKEEREKLQQQWLKECKKYIEELKKKGLLH